MIKGREGKGPPAADLLVCFPTRHHLTLMPKPICSPARPSEPPGRHNHHPRRRHHHHLRKSSFRGGGRGSHGSPLMWPKTKPNNSDISEPTSPKVTCAGQIKVRPKPTSCKNWQSVMEEIERLHSNRKHKKKLPWIEALGFKKDVMQFLTCLRNIRFDFRCFGAFPTADITSDDEDEEEDDEDIEYQSHRFGSKEDSTTGDSNENSRTVFSKWFMILQENNQTSGEMDGKSKGKVINYDQGSVDIGTDDDLGSCAPPPPNALLLMRCRSAPAKSWLEEKEEEAGKGDESENDEKEEENNDQSQIEEADRKERLLVMRCGTEFSKLSSDIAKETWVMGGIKDMLSRSRSWKR